MFLLQERAKDSQDAHFLLALVFFFSQSREQNFPGKPRGDAASITTTG